MYPILPWVPMISMCRCARPLATDWARRIMPSTVMVCLFR